MSKKEGSVAENRDAIISNIIHNIYPTQKSILKGYYLGVENIPEMSEQDVLARAACEIKKISKYIVDNHLIEDVSFFSQQIQNNIDIIQNSRTEHKLKTKTIHKSLRFIAQCMCTKYNFACEIL